MTRKEEEADETAEGLPTRSLALASSCLLMSRTSASIDSPFHSRSSREIMILTYASCRVTVDLNGLNNAGDNRRQPFRQTLDTLTAYITVNVAVDAIDAGKRLKGGEMTAFKQKTRDTVSSTLAQFRKGIDLKDYKETRSFAKHENMLQEQRAGNLLIIDQYIYYTYILYQYIALHVNVRLVSNQITNGILSTVSV